MRPGRRMNTAQRKPARPVSGNKDKTIKQLLGSLYADREYLEQLLKEEGEKAHCEVMSADIRIRRMGWELG